MKILKKIYIKMFLLILVTVVINGIISAEVFAFKYMLDGFYLNLDIPDGWKKIKEKNSSNEKRVYFRSNDKKKIMSVVQIKANGKISLDKLSDLDKKMYQNLGDLESERSLYSTNMRTYYFLPTNIIEKIYKSGNNKTKIIFQAASNYGYIILFQGDVDNFSEFDGILENMKIDIPFEERKKSAIIGGKNWMLDTIKLLIGLSFIYIFGRLGFLIRKNIETRKLLYKIKIELSGDGKEVNEKWYKQKNKTAIRIVISMIIIVAAYVISYLSLSKNLFLLSLLGIIPIVLGYFGILIGPDPEGIVDGAGDYI